MHECCTKDVQILSPYSHKCSYFLKPNVFGLWPLRHPKDLKLYTHGATLVLYVTPYQHEFPTFVGFIP